MVEVEPGHRLVGGHPVELVEERDHVGEVAPLVAVHVLEDPVEVGIGGRQREPGQGDRHLGPERRRHRVSRTREPHRDRPALGGGEDLRPAVLQPLHHRLARVVEGVEPAGLDHRDRRVDGVHEGRPRGRAAPVMAHLEHGGAERPAGGTHLCFGGGTGIAGEEDGLRAVVQAEDDGVLVLVAHRDWLGVEHRDRQVRRIEGDRIAGGERPGRDPALREEGMKFGDPRGAGRVAIVQEFVHLQVRDDVDHPADVVVVIMGGDEVGERGDPVPGEFLFHGR
ncbi:hypothetical protein DSECCO2_651250 [anaerobic digester metagenome]